MDLNRLWTKNQNSDNTINSFGRKIFRFSDWFAEKLIKAVAFLSIAVVILIFVFVFREAFRIFRMNKPEAASTELLVQESYGVDLTNGTGTITDNQVENANKQVIPVDKPSSTLF